MRLWFELNYNSLSSTVPTQLGNLKSMTSDFSLNNNEDLCGDVPTGMREVGAQPTCNQNLASVLSHARVTRHYLNPHTQPIENQKRSRLCRVE